VCTHSGCNSPQFSSNACLFRHQREAHGLHGNGENPHLCHFPGCERAQERNGFPRKWNLKDHMRRVHGWEEPQSESANVTPPIASAPMKRQSSSQAKARASALPIFQESHPHEYGVGQPYSTIMEPPESETSFRGIFKDARPQTNEYPPQFGYPPDFYPHESRYPY
jgi:hypothetical protein